MYGIGLKEAHTSQVRPFTVVIKGQLISKANCQAEDSPKKRTKTRRILVKTNSFVRFFEESSA